MTHLPVIPSRNHKKSYRSELPEVVFVKYVYLAHTKLSETGGCCYCLLRAQDPEMEIHLVPLKISSSVDTLKETQVTSDLVKVL